MINGNTKTTVTLFNKTITTINDDSKKKKEQTATLSS